MARGRTFSRKVKLPVADVVSSPKRLALVCREHGPAEGLLLRWRREVIHRDYAAFRPPDRTNDVDVERQIAELERFCRQLALESHSPFSAESLFPYALLNTRAKWVRS